jgi:DNA-directed RNA polymerase specialized sigma24 family protein
MLIDIKRGYEMMEEKDKTLLAARYHENLTLEKVAERFECSTSTADRRCESALRSLQRILGGDNPWQ